MSAIHGPGRIDVRSFGSLRVRRVRGVTLIELLVSLVLLAIGFLAIAPLFMQGIKANSSSFDYTVANNLAREELERLTLIPSSDRFLLVPPAVSDGTVSVDNIATYFNDLP